MNPLVQEADDTDYPRVVVDGDVLLGKHASRDILNSLKTLTIVRAPSNIPRLPVYLSISGKIVKKGSVSRKSIRGLLDVVGADALSIRDKDGQVWEGKDTLQFMQVVY